MTQLLKKYDQALPRYTSYPTVPYWKGIDNLEWDAAVKRGLFEVPQNSKESGLSLYVHVPFCRSLCSFCGCTKVISRDLNRARPFVDAVLRELDLKIERYFQSSTCVELKELHLGGGTPTWLPPELLEELISKIKKKFKNVPASQTQDISIEVDPRTFTKEHAVALQKVHANRVSLGVQDFHAETLKAIKRDQSYDLVANVVKILRDSGISSLNFDLVYGLPYQTQETMRDTISKVIHLKPSRIALYSYAHIPELKPAQKGVEKHGLPLSVDKRALYELARSELISEGYFEIGMDHFALPTDELYLAFIRKDLHRNFMGYTVQKTRVLLGLGPSSLSDVWYAFSQNEKNVEQWLAQIEAGDVAPRGGHSLSEADLLRRKLILELMCNYSVQINPSLWLETQKASLLQDDLIDWNQKEERLFVTERGRPFIRNICSIFDEYLGSSKPKSISFSRAI